MNIWDIIFIYWRYYEDALSSFLAYQFKIYYIVHMEQGFQFVCATPNQISSMDSYIWINTWALTTKNYIFIVVSIGIDNNINNYIFLIVVLVSLLKSWWISIYHVWFKIKYWLKEYVFLSMFLLSVIKYGCIGVVEWLMVNYKF